jgi:hypothetical protein
MAMFRSTMVDASTLELFSRRLAKERFEDVVAAIEKIGEMPREEGQAAFPELGLILSMTSVMALARHNREKFTPCHQNGCVFEGLKRVKDGPEDKDWSIVPCECRKRYYGDAA